LRIINAGLVLILFLIFSIPLSYLGSLHYLRRLTTNIMLSVSEINISKSFREQNTNHYEFFMHYLPENFYSNVLTREKLLKLISRVVLKLESFLSDETWRGVILMTGDKHIIKVPDDYTTIQEAINAAKPGDIIIVSPGIYHENIIIDKPISLIGKIRENTIIDGSGLGDVVCISSSGVKISNLTVTNSGSRYKGPFDGGNDAGVKLKYVNNCIISHLIVTNNTNGISIISSNSNIISDNLVLSNNKEGIFVVSSSNNLIVNNTSNLNGAHGGIWLAFSTNNIIINNTASHNLFDHGIKLYTSNNNLVKNNICEDNNKAGIFLMYSNSNILVGNICSGNKHNPSIMLYIRNNNNTIINNICNSNDEGIVLQYSSSNNIIANNTCMNNRDRGIGVMWSSNNNTIVGNKLSLNGEGISVENSSYNKICYNNILRNQRGIVILGEKSSENEIHWNNIIGNIEWNLLNEVSTEVNATLNWWGSQYGPRIIRGKILYEPWLMEPYGEHANLKIIGLIINPTVAKVGEEVVISANVTYIGDINGTFRLVLKVNGSIEATRDIMLTRGESALVTFKIVKDVAGIYYVELNGLTGTFIVKKLRPAEFKVMNLTINPTEARIGEKVTITVDVANTGEVKGICILTLKINGTAEGSKNVTLEGQSLKTISFVVVKEKSGVYEVEVNELRGTLIVKETPHPLELYILIAFAIIATGAILIYIKKRMTFWRIKLLHLYKERHLIVLT